MESNCIDNTTISPSAKPAKRIVIDLQYLNADQARQLINMFDSPEAYAENFSALKAITRGLYNLIQDKGFHDNNQIGRMFHTVNNLQGWLLLDDMQEVSRILEDSGLMPDPWHGFRENREKDCDVK